MLREREKRVLVIGGAVAAALLLLTFVLIPGVSRIKSQTRAVAAAETDLAEMRKARPEIERIQSETNAKAGIVRAAANVKDAPLSRITSALQEAGIPQAALNIKSGGVRNGELFREESFDVRIENLTYLEAVTTLQRLSAGSLPVTIRSATLKSRYDDPRYIDVTLRVGFLTPKS
ncbi:MAG: gspM [Deltaproteobacteria bacterium]|nr:gspM [Deltaproteobacteria bacterium]MBS1243903.1 gspM [Deltaproteobacteria bacterium]